jgi:hypothetical protein
MKEGNVVMLKRQGRDGFTGTFHEPGELFVVQMTGCSLNAQNRVHVSNSGRGVRRYCFQVSTLAVLE